MDEKVITMLCLSPIYMRYKDVAANYGTSVQTVRKNLKLMRECGRYNKRFLVIDDGGADAINTLMYEDFLAYKTEIKDKNLSRRIPEYNASEIRRQRGEYKLPLMAAGLVINEGKQ